MMTADDLKSEAAEELRPGELRVDENVYADESDERRCQWCYRSSRVHPTSLYRKDPTPYYLCIQSSGSRDACTEAANRHPQGHPVWVQKQAWRTKPREI